MSKYRQTQQQGGPNFNNNSKIPKDFPGFSKNASGDLPSSGTILQRLRAMPVGLVFGAVFIGIVSGYFMWNEPLEEMHYRKHRQDRRKVSNQQIQSSKSTPDS